MGAYGEAIDRTVGIGASPGGQEGRESDTGCTAGAGAIGPSTCELIGPGVRDLDFLITGFWASAAFLAASAARSAATWDLDRLGLRIRPSRLNRAQWLSMASVRRGFLALAIFSRRASSAGSRDSLPSALLAGVTAGETVAWAPLRPGSIGAS